jgi:hypothetical protein
MHIHMHIYVCMHACMYLCAATSTGSFFFMSWFLLTTSEHPPGMMRLNSILAARICYFMSPDPPPRPPTRVKKGGRQGAQRRERNKYQASLLSLLLSLTNAQTHTINRTQKREASSGWRFTNGMVTPIRSFTTLVAFLILFSLICLCGPHTILLLQSWSWFV